MAGRTPKPTALKVVTGNPSKRALNKNEPKPDLRIPECPEYIVGNAKNAWDKLAVMLESMGVLTIADGLALERLCECYAEILECRELIELNGRVYSSVSGEDGMLLKANPAVGQLQDADRRFKSYLVEFGLTPASRSKIQVIQKEDDKQDPLKEFFG